MPHSSRSRREVLSKCFAAGFLISAPPLGETRALALWEAAELRTLKPTPPNDLGPFYKADAPRINRLSRPGEAGLPLLVSGAVFDSRGNALPGANLEIWQADPSGKYDKTGFHYRAQFTAGQDGSYTFETNMPGHYPMRVCQHIHYKVSALGHKTLTTQLYFATDPALDGDPDRNYGKDPVLRSRELIRPVTIFADPQSIHAAVQFEIVLEPA
jgi:protocatechuate 3,4-dioxygenase beta subunit